METKIEYSFVVSELVKLRDVVIANLKINQSQELLSRKTEIDRAIRWLEKGQEFNIHPKSKITVLPDTRVQTPSSEYRVIEDCESDDPNYWIEVKVKGESIKPLPGSLIVERS
ncbi:MAG: hypothetical protein AAF992_08220 [Bacteroidota bacterium]